MPIAAGSYAHVRLTVTVTVTITDASRAFDDKWFAPPVAFEVPSDADDATRAQLGSRFGGVIYQLGDSLLGLRPVADDQFSENRVGLDHVSFAVTNHSDIEPAGGCSMSWGSPIGV